jgi:hypothetical protein
MITVAHSSDDQDLVMIRITTDITASKAARANSAAAAAAAVRARVHDSGA